MAKREESKKNRMNPDPREVYAVLPLELPPRSWWRPWARGPARCAHLDSAARARIQLRPDRVWLHEPAQAVALREAMRPPIEVCVECLLKLLENEIKTFGGRVIAFEPAENFSQYVFIEQQHLGDIGLGPEDLIHCQSLVAEPLGGCQTCASEARLLWVKRGSTTENRALITYRGGRGYYCLPHGAALLVTHLRERLRAPLAYFNLPYGERGVYIPTCA